MKKISYLLMIATLISYSAQSQKRSENNDFAFFLYKNLVKTKSDNFIFSPYGISQCMAMVYSGANNETQKEIQKAMMYSGNNEAIANYFCNTNKYLNCLSDTVSLQINNQLFLQKKYKLLPSYLNEMTTKYNADVTTANFKRKRSKKKAIKKINKSISKATRDNIKKLLSDNDATPNTKLILTNAVWFKADWANGFKKEETTEQPFTNLDNTKSTVKMMYQKSKFLYYETPRIKVIKLPYKGGKMNLMVILPIDNKEFIKVENMLTLRMIKKIENDMTKVTLPVELPKFKLESDFNLKETFMAMGMRLPFSNNADFSKMTSKNNLKIDKVIHKANIDVSEKGTEAAAATAVVMTLKCALPPYYFTANKPFIYLLQDDKNNVVFMGRVIHM